MPPKNDRRPWIKLWVDECLRGTVREEMTAEERGVWYDFLLLAGSNRVRGRISANETQPQSPARIAAILNVDVNVISHCVGKFMEQGRITVDKVGIIHIVNWETYQYSDYDRQKPYRQASALERAREAIAVRDAAQPTPEEAVAEAETKTGEQLIAEDLAAHPEKVLGSVKDDSYDTDKVYSED